MRKYIAYALVLIALAALVVWLISKFVQPILPPNINADLLLLVAAVSGVFGLPEPLRTPPSYCAWRLAARRSRRHSLILKN